MRSICIAVAMLISSAIAAYAQSDDYRVIVTGPGGAAFDDVCRGTDVLVGFNYTAYDAVNTISGVCETQDNGITTGVIYTLATHGLQPSSGSPPYVRFGIEGSLRCPGAMAIHEMTVSLDKYNEVQGIDGICAGLVSSDTRSPTHISATSDGTAATNKHIACSSGDIAHGLIGQSGTQIDGVGLQCASFPWSRSPPPTNIVKVIAAADVYDHPGGSGQPIYPDGLDPAAPKNIVLVYLLEVGKDDNVNWYRVNWNGSPPQPLWVYSGVAANDQITFDAASLATAKATVNGGH